MPNYDLLTSQLRALGETEPFYVPLFANASALLWETLTDINWAGFYILRGGALVLGPFQGKPACIRIESGHGVCGTALETASVQRVADVHAFPGHIACDSASRSEIVLPVHCGGKVTAVLDIDSPALNRFTKDDERGLRAFVTALEEIVVFSDTPQEKSEPLPKLRSGRYRHFKGREYELLSVARHSETGEPMVVYRALYDEGGVWVRPASMWNEDMTREGITQKRFTYIGEVSK